MVRPLCIGRVGTGLEEVGEKSHNGDWGGGMEGGNGLGGLREEK